MRRSIYNIIKTTPTVSLDQVLSLLAPHKCLGCGAPGRTLCADCSELVVSPPPQRCFNCQALSDNYKTCRKCKKTVLVDSVLSAGPYDGIHKQLVMKMKKDASRHSAKDIADALALLIQQNSYLSDCDVIVPVPTIARHSRERGFDHTKSIVTALSGALQLPILELLTRTTDTRQVGKSRKERFAQMQNAVNMKEVKSLNGVNILLLDDIATTGATLSACTRILKQAGAKRVDAVVFASGR